MGGLVIKFSHWYRKMPPHVLEAKLLDVWVLDSSSLSEEFVEYDTEYLGGRYNLPKGKVIVLLLESKGLWTTVRRHTEQKHAYYHKRVGAVFKIEVKA